MITSATVIPGLIRVILLGFQWLGHNVFEGIAHYPSITTTVTKASRAVHQLLLRQFNELPSSTLDGDGGFQAASG